MNVFVNTSDHNDIFKVDDSSDLPIWVQLRNRITFLIRTGYFKAGDQLPSVRSLSADAKINYNTVTKAYRELELAGLVTMVRGRGMYVKETSDGQDNPELDAADMLFEDCVRKYRALGMTFDDIETRLQSFVKTERQRFEEATEPRTDHHGTH